MSRSTHVTAAATLSMVGASLCFATLDATGKFLVQTFPAPFVVWVRYIVQTALLLVILAPRMRGNLLRTHSFALQILRGVLLVVSSVLIVTGFRTLPLAEATALCFFAPAIVTVLAIVLLGEHVTRARSVCVVAGLIGVLLIARPGSSIFQPAALFPLAGALTSACYQLLTRKLAGEDARTMLFYTAFVGMLVMTLLMPWEGAPTPTRWQDITALGAIGAISVVGHFLFIRALQLAPASGLASISYVQLVFATVIGFFVYGAFPDHWALTGMLIIAGSGLFLTWYERRRAVVPIGEPPAVD